MVEASLVRVVVRMGGDAFAILFSRSRVRGLLKRMLLAMLVVRGVALAQTPDAAAPQLSPKAAYDDAIHPLELTRRSMGNWSDTEVAALTVSMARATADCAVRDPQTFNGSDLIDLAKLCALGQNFPAVVEATSRYLAAEGEKPQRTQAYAGLVDAQLHLKDEAAALKSAKDMLAAVPYDTLAAETVDEALHFMQFLYTSDAVALGVARQPQLLALLGAAGTGMAQAPGYAGAEAPQSVHDLYADGMMLAALQQLDKAKPASVAATVAALNAALPATLKADDAIPIEIERRRYDLLGKPLLNLAHPARFAKAAHAADAHKTVVFASLNLPGTLPEIPAHHAETALLLFPDWCAQCIRMATKIPPTVFSVAGHEAYLYGLMAETVAPNPAPAGAATMTTVAAADAANYLRGTPTLVVDPALLDEFGADDFPFLILTDSQGMVRVLQPVSDDALNLGGTIDAAIAHVGARWPSPLLPPPTPFPGKKAVSPGLPRTQ